MFFKRCKRATSIVQVYTISDKAVDNAIAHQREVQLYLNSEYIVRIKSLLRHTYDIEG